MDGELGAAAFTNEVGGSDFLVPLSSAKTVSASATIATGSLSVGRHLIFVRGRGINSVSGNPTWGPITAAWLRVQ